MTNKEQILEEFEKEFRQMASDTLFESLSNKHPLTGKQMTMKEGKEYFNKRVNDVLQKFSKALSLTQQATIEEMEETLKEGEKEAIEVMAKKYKTYNYNFMEGVFALKNAVQDILDKLKKESR